MKKLIITIMILTIPLSLFAQWGGGEKQFKIQQAPTVTVKNIEIEFPKTTARYVKIKAQNINVCPEWHKGAGGKAWLFIDEIVIE